MRLRTGVEVVPGQSGDVTIRADGVWLHSRYNPRDEAVRLIGSAALEPDRPVLVLGVGAGYHVAELLRRGFSVAAIEPDASVAKCAVESVLADSDVPLAVLDPEGIAGDSELRDLILRRPQLLVHPPTERRSPAIVAAMRAAISRIQLDRQPLGIAVVSPMYGGSLPIAGYLASAFQSLGHRVLLVDNSEAWPLYQSVTSSVRTKTASSQLGNLLANVLEQWTYARIAEFSPNVCIALAQAPLSPAFPARLQKENIVSAFWFVENWRHMPYWTHIAPRYDCFFHIQPGEFDRRLDEAGCRNHLFVQTGCDPAVHRPVALTDEERSLYQCDLAFAGAGYHNRNEFFKGLTDYNFKIWGTEWTARELQPLVCRPDERFTAETFAKIVAGAKINLNLHSSAAHFGIDPQCDAINPRVFEIAACGGFQLCDPCKGLEEFFDCRDELPVYNDLAECRKKIDYYLAHADERNEIAARARCRALRDHTYELRAKVMLDFILDRFSDRIAEKGIRVQYTVGQVAERVGKDTDLGRYLASLPPDLPFTQSSLSERIPVMGTKLSYPEGVFSYLRELRSSAELLLAMFDGA